MNHGGAHSRSTEERGARPGWREDECGKENEKLRRSKAMRARRTTRNAGVQKNATVKRGSRPGFREGHASRAGSRSRAEKSSADRASEYPRMKGTRAGEETQKRKKEKGNRENTGKGNRAARMNEDRNHLAATAPVMSRRNAEAARRSRIQGEECHELDGKKQDDAEGRH
ncbi:hypothetical protein B0H17DRAFT_1149025 [Mycena rosella]|uniref:Uncharacterized protein n=1 Tax=Mycena rosella TaxID=1033263 RepID=A0AAD7C6L8_MYCRO|nr:hypothetical protein B0H17DRAFT_1149025 [Mycena rosella]